MNILVYGCAEFGQVVKNLAMNCGHNIIGFIDDYNDKSLGTYEEIRKSFHSSDYSIAIGIGYKSLETRWGIYQKVKSDGYDVINLIHTKAIVDESARIGEGVVIMAGTVVDYKAEIGDLSVLWNGAVVSHDSVIKENTFLSPNCTVCGSSVIGKNCFIGAGAVITDHIIVTDGSFVKAGSVIKWK